MIRDLKSFYVAIVGNQVICFETNLKLFHEEIKKLEGDIRNYDWFYRAFKKNGRFSLVIEGKEYYFQKVI